MSGSDPRGNKQRDLRITDLVDAQRRELARREEAAALELARAYALLADALEPQLRALAAAIEARGDHASPTWLRQQELYKRLLAGARGAYQEYGRQAARAIERQYEQALDYGLRDARMLLALEQIAPPEPTRQERAALAAQQRRRLARLALPRSVSSLAVAGLAEVLRRAVKRLVALPELITKARERLGGILINVLRASRTESTTAYRAIVLSRFAAANRVTGWQWAAELAKSPAPCPVCVALHGQVFAMDEPFGSHPGCRCLAIPVIEGVGPALAEAGEAWLARQDEARQVAVLGRGKRRHFAAGRLRLADLVVVAEHPIYGVSRHERSLKSLGLDAPVEA